MVRFIGIDLGGTNVRVCAMDENDEIGEVLKEPTFSEGNTAEEVLRHVINMIRKIRGYASAASIGLSVAGSVSDNRIVTAKNLPMLIGYPVVEKLINEFDKPVIMINDARAAAYGEALKGAGRGYPIVCYITVSTGLGGGIVMNGKIYQGSNGFGGYIPRIILNGKDSSDGLLSGRVLMEKAQELNLSVCDPEELFGLNTVETEKIRNEFINNLTVLLLNLSATFNSDIVVFGGGVMKAERYFMKEAIASFREKAHPMVREMKITNALLEEPGLVGICLLASQLIA